MSCGKHCNNDNHTCCSGEQGTGKEYWLNREALDIMENIKKKKAKHIVGSLMVSKEENAERRKELTEETKALIGKRLMLTTGAEPILKNQYQMCLNALKYAENEGTASKKDLRELETTMCNARSDYNNLVNQIYDCEHKINHLKTQLLHLKQKYDEQDYWVRFINDELTSEEIQENQELIEKEEQKRERRERKAAKKRKRNADKRRKYKEKVKDGKVSKAKKAAMVKEAAEELLKQKLKETIVKKVHQRLGLK
tara:strand:+ start:248 stop:1006 length:759 start_codon:yes stop_codon:yes gene_type:complete